MAETAPKVPDKETKVKANITWLGGGEDDDTEFVIFRGVKYERDKPLESENPELIAKAEGNPYFKVELLEGVMPKITENSGQNPPPSRVSAQGPVQKPGEPPGMAGMGSTRPPPTPPAPTPTSTPAAPNPLLKK